MGEVIAFSHAPFVKCPRCDRIPTTESILRVECACGLSTVLGPQDKNIQMAWTKYVARLRKSIKEEGQEAVFARLNRLYPRKDN